MNYYERYCGDYAKKTAHLSLTEHGAYTMMLDTYYSTERALPAELGLLYRICRAMTKIEQAAVAKVAGEFFPIGPDGLRHQDRADAMIAGAQPRIAAARANGQHGGRRKTKPNRNPPGSAQEPTGNLPGSPSATRPGEALPQAPSTTPQTPNPKPNPEVEVNPTSQSKDALSRGRLCKKTDASPSGSADSHGTRLPKDWELPEDWGAWAQSERPEFSEKRISSLADAFADYWHGVPGKAGRKADWPGTWRNWIRREKSDRKGVGDERQKERKRVIDELTGSGGQGRTIDQETDH